MQFIRSNDVVLTDRGIRPHGEKAGFFEFLIGFSRSGDPQRTVGVVPLALYEFRFPLTAPPPSAWLRHRLCCPLYGYPFRYIQYRHTLINDYPFCSSPHAAAHVRGEKWVHDDPRGLCVNPSDWISRTHDTHVSRVCDSVVLALSPEHVFTCLLLFDLCSKGHKSIRSLPDFAKSNTTHWQADPYCTPHYVQLAKVTKRSLILQQDQRTSRAISQSSKLPYDSHSATMLCSCIISSLPDTWTLLGISGKNSGVAQLIF